MERIVKIAPKIPVVIICNKLDLADDENQLDETEFYRIAKILKPLVKHYHQVEMGMECSVK